MVEMAPPPRGEVVQSVRFATSKHWLHLVARNRRCPNPNCASIRYFTLVEWGAADNTADSWKHKMIRRALRLLVCPNFGTSSLLGRFSGFDRRLGLLAWNL